MSLNGLMVTVPFHSYNTIVKDVKRIESTPWLTYYLNNYTVTYHYDITHRTNIRTYIYTLLRVRISIFDAGSVPCGLHNIDYERQVYAPK